MKEREKKKGGGGGGGGLPRGKKNKIGIDKRAETCVKPVGGV